MKCCKSIVFGAALLALLAFGAQAQAVVLSTFDSGSWGNGMTGLTGTYVDWSDPNATFTQNATSLTVVATAFGGGWMVPAALIDGTANGEDTLQLTVDINSGNAATGINVVLFSVDAGTQAGFSFDITGLFGPQVLTADLNNPDFFNAGNLGTWDPTQIGPEMHIQGNFADSNVLDIDWEDLRTIPEPASISLLGLACMAALCRKSRS